MCLFFYLAGVATGYLAWRMTSAPKLWDMEEERNFWRTQWNLVKNENDLLAGRLSEE
jgi:hypothetical protein